MDAQVEFFEKDQKVRHTYLGEKMKTKRGFLSTKLIF